MKTTPLNIILFAALFAAPTWSMRLMEGDTSDLNTSTAVDAQAAAETEVEMDGEVELVSGTGLQAGSLMFNRYELISVLTGWPAKGVKGYSKIKYMGKGAFGETWLAKDTTSGKEVAIKFFYRPDRYKGAILLNMQNANHNEKAQLRTAGTECDIPKRIISAKKTTAGADRFSLCIANHVNDRDHAHLVLEVAGTADLEGWVQKNKRSVTGALAKRIAKMMLEALEQMEGHYVHRDIKPANVMVYEAGGQFYLRLIDFGLVINEGNSRDGIGGTPMFMPPEFWPVIPSRYSFHSSFDVYSVGETLYWLICGKTFHEMVFNKVGARGDAELKRALVSRQPSTECRPPDQFKDLFNFVCDNMLQSSENRRAKPSSMVNWEGFRGIETVPKPNKPIEPTKPNKPIEPAKPIKPVVPVVVTPVIEKPPEPTFLDKCHDSKEFWFKNLAGCCLRERFDKKREAVCMRPCGPRVGYQNGACASNCGGLSNQQMEFSKTKYCCVATVWRTKCIYPNYIPSGEGWRWMQDEGM